jgi:chemotaxis protein CheD
MDHFIQIAELKVASSSDMLKTVVGSCIALCLWDRESGTGGMVHIMLPSHGRSRDGLKSKYADTAVNALLDEMEKKGSLKRNLVASIVGGASIFGRPGKAAVPSVGMLNYESVRGQLREQTIPVRLEEIGGPSGRRVVLDCSNGLVSVTTLGNGKWSAGKAGVTS